MTVSRVINREANVRALTRERVMAAVEALRYSPNAAARSLAGAAQTRLVLLHGNPSAAYLSEVLVGCLTEATRDDVQLLLEKSESWEGAAHCARRAIEQRVDGVILPPPYSDRTEIISLLQAAGMPSATLASGVAGSLVAISIDDAKAAFDMTAHLLELGHRRIGFVVGNLDQHASAERREGYRRALHEAGVPIDPALIVQGDFSYRSGLKAAEQLLNLVRMPTAIFASNDDMAAAAVAAAHRRHLDVPEDLSVVGFDDTGMATTISPTLTTVRQPVEDMARAAVELLTEAAHRARLGERPLPVRRLFAHEIVRRESDAVPHHATRREGSRKP